MDPNVNAISATKLSAQHFSPRASNFSFSSFTFFSFFIPSFLFFALARNRICNERLTGVRVEGVGEIVRKHSRVPVSIIAEMYREIQGLHDRNGTRASTILARRLAVLASRRSSAERVLETPTYPSLSGNTVYHVSPSAFVEISCTRANLNFTLLSFTPSLRPLLSPVRQLAFSIYYRNYLWYYRYIY